MYKVGVFPGKFFPPHRGHINAIIHAATQCEKLYVVVSDNMDIANQECFACGIRMLPLELRARWMAKDLKGFDHIQVMILDETGIPPYPEGTVPWSKKLKEAVPEKFDAIFGGEVEYKDTYMVNFPGVDYVLYDYDRSRYHMSGTKIRNNPLEHWDYILGPARAHFAKRVLITGTESCGKSTLAEYLGKIFHTSWTREYGRYFIEEELGGCGAAITTKDFIHIAKIQEQWDEEAIRSANRIAFFDSDATVTKYYCELYTGKDCPELDGFINLYKYDKIIFLEPSVKWVGDGQRFVSDQKLRENLSLKLRDMYGPHARYAASNSLNGRFAVCNLPSYKDRLDFAILIADMLLEGRKKNE